MTTPENKDYERVINILDRAKLDHNKSLALATRMANSIKGGVKALKRAHACNDIAKGLPGTDPKTATYFAMAHIFADRASILVKGV